MTVVEKAVAKLKRELGESITVDEPFRGQTSMTLDREVIVTACQMLRDDPDLDFNFLAALTAVDYWPSEPRFKIVYQLYSLANKEFIGLRVLLSGESPEISTIENIYPNANWHEREVFDMFGVTFKDHSDQRRIIMPYDWEGHPLRKDYPLGYEEVQFTFNFDEIDKRKPYAKE
ncbi:MAG: NADH-quinone oxidoreductase subunit C [Anaerolineales bacterium]|nr:MAG: NADH-quinone oxidoreductase subunit C [Anaerolineales bacterium]